MRRAGSEPALFFFFAGYRLIESLRCLLIKDKFLPGLIEKIIAKLYNIHELKQKEQNA